MTDEQLARDLAQRFRSALETEATQLAARNGALIGLREFPIGACLDASLLLAEYLREHDQGSWRCLAGERLFRPAQPESHAWVERDGLVVDITADQFADSPGPAVWVTRNNAWHAQFAPAEDQGQLWRPQDEELLDAYAVLRDTANRPAA
ncbi:hypothetical protein [Streptomyces rubellomurinus]|uniref:hypothetical protein n=1 Tax=Streptomyces rubellomurinus (strain ATCC 31215) TaxID=359131 RepID=UPI0006969CF8|nr:hypothetical protein [Streptomyces rubellomurinus]